MPGRRGACYMVQVCTKSLMCDLFLVGEVLVTWFRFVPSLWCVICARSERHLLYGSTKQFTSHWRIRGVAPVRATYTLRGDKFFHFCIDFRQKAPTLKVGTPQQVAPFQQEILDLQLQVCPGGTSKWDLLPPPPNGTQ